MEISRTYNSFLTKSLNPISTQITQKSLLPQKVEHSSNPMCKYSGNETQSAYNAFKIRQSAYMPKEKNSSINRHFYNLEQNIVSEVKLSEAEKKELLNRINQFEQYKATLNDEELNELEKNKHGMLDYSIKDGYPDEKLASYQEFLKKYENYKSGDFSNLTNEDLAQLLYHTDTSCLQSDGKIGYFAQGRVGDCWYLSMLSNYASSEEGAQNIANRISGPDKDGNYHVKYNNPLNIDEVEDYVVTKEELQNFDLSDENSSYSSGDLDVRIMEIATSKMLEKYLENYNDEEDFYKGIAEGNPIKRMLVHKAMGYESNITTYFTPDSYFLQSITDEKYLEETNANIYKVEYSLTMENGELKCTPNIIPTEYENFSQVLSNNNYKSSELTCGTGHKQYSNDEKEQRYIQEGHAYNLMSANEKEGAITVNDPYNSAFPHTISLEKFDETFTEITYLPSN